MEQEYSPSFLSTKRYAVVTGGNKGIGIEICRQLASNGIKVVLTARDEKRGLEAVEKLIKESNFTREDHVVFHRLDVVDPDSIASLADFIKTQFGKLDILINNAGIAGGTLDSYGYAQATELAGENGNWNEIMTQNYESAEECLKTNYYGAKATIEALLPLLQLSDSPRIVNVSSSIGLLQYMPNEWAKNMLSDVDKLREERIDEVVSEFLKDFKQGNLEAKKWPTEISGYKVSKASLNAYQRILAKKYPHICVNCVCPGYVKTDITCNTGQLVAAEGAESPVMLALLPHAKPSGLFFSRKQVSPF
ncbi:(+)-neomenthol dehydrogenase-like isoform X2 [Humulus lupulus]|uniref:(+)-neomenthol dehydrogenase-like isoform X2 n=1 Tax=Humulus lupulus TaxID=3486 RepID=UPI002B41865A|nr:(+)-neomenthol dehydrogenase-like isoform X2 [Humulus lupulus]